MEINLTDKLKIFTSNNCLTSVVLPSFKNNHSNRKNINANSHNIKEVVLVKGDITASHHYWREQDKHVLNEIQEFTGPSVLIPNGEKISATKKSILPLSTIFSPVASISMLLPGLTSVSLISIGQLCDDGCDVFKKKLLIAVKEKEIVLEGTKNVTDGL